jgi:hypothetical protein
MNIYAQMFRASTDFFRSVSRFIDYGVSCCSGALSTANFLCYDPAFDATVTNVRRELGNRADTIMRNVEVIRAPVAEGRYRRI